MEQLSDEEVEVREEEEGGEEEDDSDKEDQDLDKMFGAWLGELDKLTQVCQAVTLITIINTEDLRSLHYSLRYCTVTSSGYFSDCSFINSPSAPASYGGPLFCPFIEFIRPDITHWTINDISKLLDAFCMKLLM